MSNDNMGTKLDGGKVRMDLLDPLALEQIAMAMTYGAEKYEDNNWRKGIKLSRLIASSMRHLLEFMKGTDTDEESGLSHLAHLGANVMMLTNMYNTRLDLDDRFSSKLVVGENIDIAADECDWADLSETVSSGRLERFERTSIDDECDEIDRIINESRKL